MATYLSRTPSSAGNRKIFTISLWFKRSEVGDRNCLLSTDGSNDHDRFELTIHQNNYLMVGLNSFNVFETNMLFRDISAWYHIMFVADTTQGSSSNRTKLYINGSQVTSFSANNQNSISSNFDFGVNNTNAHKIGASPSSTDGTNGYIADFNLIDGSALTPSSFGETDSTTGIWKPKSISGVTYGTNGVYLQFKNAGALGTDTSGNSNTYAVNNAGTNAQVTDTPTNNFATYNSLAKDGTPADNHDYTLGNTVVQNSSANWFTAFGSLGIPTSGKWYYEYTTSGSGTIDQLIGFAKSNFDRGSDAGADTTGCYTLYAASNGNGFLFTNSGSSVNKGTSYCWTHGDTMMVAIDSSTRKIWYGKNGTWLSGGNPATGTTEDQTVTAADMAYGLLPVVSGYHTGSLQKINFGNPSYTISSGNNDGAGFGNFEYAVPSGYYALCTRNINTYG